MAIPNVEKFAERMAWIVGNENVITDPKKLEEYSKDQSFIEPRKPLFVVRPKSSEEVQAIVQECNRYGMPIASLGSSFTNNQGCTIPRVPGITLDLRLMNRIVAIDERAWMVAIEPGVTFKQLQGELKKYNLRVLTPTELPSHASVISAYLDYAPLYEWVRYGDHLAQSMSLVLGNGDLFKTGFMTIPTALRPYVSHYGAPWTGITTFIWYGSQGTLGIATLCYLKVKAMRDLNKVLWCPLNDLGDLHRIVREFWRLREAKGMILVNSMDLALMLAEKYPSEVLDLREKLPRFMLIMWLRGSAEEVDYQLADIKDAASKLGLKIYESSLPELGNAEERFLKEVDCPEGWIKWSRYKGARNTLPFIARVKMISQYYELALKLAREHNYPEKDVGLQVVFYDGGKASVQLSYARDPNNLEETQRVKNLYYETARQLMLNGAFFSRPYGPIARLVFDRCPNYVEVLRRLKKTIDPNNILCPGVLPL